MVTQTDQKLRQIEETPCTADIGITEAELEAENLGTRALFSQMPASGPGFECYGPEHKRYGRSEVIRTITHIGTIWQKEYPDGPRIGVGNISYQAGGKMEPHKSHQKGIDVDLAPVASTHEEIALTWHSPKYSRKRTQQLVDLISNNLFVKVRTILFNDPDIRGVSPSVGHDNHLHVSFFPSQVATASFSSDQSGDLRLVMPYMKGERVRKLQKNLAAANIQVEIDGIFGTSTDAAVREFQSQHGLEVDGVAGSVTLAKLRQVRLQNLQPQQRSESPVSEANTVVSSGAKLQALIQENRSIDFSDLNDSELVDDQALCREIQMLLQANRFLATADGLYGPKTREALRTFKAQNQLKGGDVLTPETAETLLSARPASGKLPDWAGGDKQATIQAIKQEAQRQGITNPSQIAYILATVEHETAGSFQPVRESYYLGEPKAEAHRKTLRYYPYYGRGYVQLTWDYNYRKYSTLTGLDLVNHPDLVMRPDVSLFVLTDGMKRGVFTGVSLEDFMVNERLDFVKARKIINGTDKARMIAGIAENWVSGFA